MILLFFSLGSTEGAHSRKRWTEEEFGLCTQRPDGKAREDERRNSWISATASGSWKETPGFASGYKQTGKNVWSGDWGNWRECVDHGDEAFFPRRSVFCIIIMMYNPVNIPSY